MELKNKLITVLTVLLLLLVLAGFGAFKPKPAESGNSTQAASDTKAVKIKSLGGIKSRMPENSAAVFFGSTIGQSLSRYEAYKNMDETLCALRSGEIDAVWACDVTADYLVAVNDDLEIFEPDTESDIQKTEASRFEFGMALKDTPESVKLRDEINKVLSDMKQDGCLDTLTSAYIKNAPLQETGSEETRYYPSRMVQDNRKDTIYVGISGAVSPIELLDRNDEPYGFCVALMDEIGSRLNRRIKFVVLDNETAFTSLMSGRVDMIFCYGTGRKTTENKASYIMTDGYLSMQKYRFLKRK